MAKIHTENSQQSPVPPLVRLFSREEVAATLGITTRYLDSLIYTKEITATRIGARVLVSYPELCRFIKEQTSPPSKAERLRYVRQHANLTIEQLADKTQINKEVLIAAEAGETLPREMFARAIAIAVYERLKAQPESSQEAVPA